MFQLADRDKLVKGMCVVYLTPHNDWRFILGTAYAVVGRIMANESLKDECQCVEARLGLVVLLPLMTALLQSRL